MDVVADFQAGGISNYIKGIQSIGSIMYNLPKDLEDCKGIAADYTKIKKWAAIFTHPIELMQVLSKNVMAHFFEISGAINNAMAEYKDNKFYDFGKDIGKVMILAVGPAELLPFKVDFWAPSYWNFENN